MRSSFGVMGVAALVLLVSAGCARRAPGKPADGADEREDIAAQRMRGRVQRFAWEGLSPAVLERARTEGKFILLHGAAEWCHWCHVMEETTYRDPQVGALVAARFVAIRVDMDTRPDFAERYSAWGWPATIVLTPDGTEVAKYRGYVEPERMVELLNQALASTVAPSARAALRAEPRLAPEDLGYAAARALLDMDDAYDAELGSWGSRQKLSLPDNVRVELKRAAAGDLAAAARARFTLQQTRALEDPVWGGIYQYSTGGTWQAPHFEKLMVVQAGTLHAQAEAARVLDDVSFLKDAFRTRAYVNRFLRSSAGTFFTNQDADVGAHDRAAPFMDGHRYHALPEPQRLAIGVPWVDTHVYARENGLLIQALCALHAASGDAEVLQDAVVALTSLQAHVRTDGTVLRTQGAADGDVRFLVDAAELGRAAACVAQRTQDARWKEAAVHMAVRMESLFGGAPGGALFDQTADPAASGVFAERTASLPANVAAALLLAEVTRLTGDSGFAQRGRKLLAAAATARALKEQGRTQGGFLLAAEALGCAPW